MTPTPRLWAMVRLPAGVAGTGRPMDTAPVGLISILGEPLQKAPAPAPASVSTKFPVAAEVRVHDPPPTPTLLSWMFAGTRATAVRFNKTPAAGAPPIPT